jgi:hypothetical protein
MAHAQDSMIGYRILQILVVFILEKIYNLIK